MLNEKQRYELNIKFCILKPLPLINSNAKKQAKQNRKKTMMKSKKKNRRKEKFNDFT